MTLRLEVFWRAKFLHCIVMKDKKIDEGDLTTCGIDTKIDEDKVVRLNEQLFLGLALKTEGDAVDLARADRDELGPPGVRWVELIQMTSDRSPYVHGTDKRSGCALV